MAIRKKIDVCLVADRSISLKHEGPIINEALRSMLESIKNNPYLHGCEIYFTLVSFANTMTKHADFAPIETVSAASLQLTFDGQTNPAPALSYVVSTAYDRYYKWRNDGEEAFHPLIFFFTDGNPYPLETYMPEYEKIAAKTKRLEELNKLVVVCAGYGGVNPDNLKLMTNYSERVLQMTDGKTDKLNRFFSVIIPATVTAAVTDTFDQMADVFRFFTLS